ncbi:alpha/beta hydrolase [Cognatilysobacter terrigena]|uniref:alpha/beta hydrolase n=1 Tax=Cognatilysobacter terrigena TaxID=2488749 RepID=UPI0014150467|nr:dienelactone hydrolase family protein [Lysobacter terrigena]
MSTSPCNATTSDLIDAADYAYSHVVVEPRPDPARALLVLLHGVGGDEHQLAALGERMPPDTLVVLPRGHRTISGGRLGWYRIGLSDDGLQVVEDEEAEARAKLVDFIAQLQSRYDVAPERTWIGGFSQGGILAATTALTTPASMAGFFMMSGRLLPEMDCADGEAAHLEALVVHGHNDDTLPVDDARDAASRLEALGLTTQLELFDTGHEVDDAMVDAVAQWLEARLAHT